MGSLRSKFLRASLFSVLACAAGASVRAQELKDELDALEDIPPDDLSASASKPKAKPEAAAPKVADPLDDLPVGESEAKKAAPKAAPKMAEAELPADIPVDDAVEPLGSDTDVGLEKELRSLDDRTEPTIKPPISALTGVDNEPAAKITHLDFRQLPDRVRLTVKSDRVMDFQRELRSKRKQIILEVRNATLSRTILRRALDTGEFDGPVALVQAFESKAGTQSNVKVLFQLRQFVDPTVLKTGNDLIVDFPILTDTTIFKSKNANDVYIPETFLSINTKMRSEGHKINLSVKDAELQDVLNLISRASGKNFIVSGGSAAKVTLNVKSTPWDEALRIILVNAKLGYQKVGNVYRIAPLSDLRQEIDDSAASAAKQEDLLPLETRLYALSYAKAKDVSTNIADFKSKRGKSSVDERTNTLVVTDLPEVLERIARYVKSVDRQTAQILIEGRVVEAKREFLQQLNVRWGLPINAGGVSGNLNIGRNDGLRNFVQIDHAWAGINAILGAEEQEKNIRTVASPRVLALDNQPATIQQGDSFPVPTPSTPTTPGGITYVDALLDLQVTPQVTSDGYVMMKVSLKKDTPVPGTQGVSKRKAETQVLVESGKTVVLGGIYARETNDSSIGLPWLRGLPILGALFRNTTTNSENTNELLMFISPKIMNPEKAFLVNVDSEEGQKEASASGRPITTPNSEAIGDDTF